MVIGHAHGVHLVGGEQTDAQQLSGLLIGFGVHGGIGVRLPLQLVHQLFSGSGVGLVKLLVGLVGLIVVCHRVPNTMAEEKGNAVFGHGLDDLFLHAVGLAGSAGKRIFPAVDLEGIPVAENAGGEQVGALLHGQTAVVGAGGVAGQVNAPGIHIKVVPEVFRRHDNVAGAVIPTAHNETGVNSSDDNGFRRIQPGQSGGIKRQIGTIIVDHSTIGQRLFIVRAAAAHQLDNQRVLGTALPVIALGQVVVDMQLLVLLGLVRIDQGHAVKIVHPHIDPCVHTHRIRRFDSGPVNSFDLGLLLRRGLQVVHVIVTAPILQNFPAVLIVRCHQAADLVVQIGSVGEINVQFNDHITARDTLPVLQCLRGGVGIDRGDGRRGDFPVGIRHQGLHIVGVFGNAPGIDLAAVLDGHRGQLLAPNAHLCNAGHRLDTGIGAVPAGGQRSGRQTCQEHYHRKKEAEPFLAFSELLLHYLFIFLS